ncbi:MAG: NAD(P)H-hydrate dehydratase [Leptolyngbyaceae cyanobacterium]
MTGRGIRPIIQSTCVTAAQMQAIEGRLFAAGMPTAALMEKVAGRIVDYWQQRWPLNAQAQKIGILVGPGHNGGDALVVARELYLMGYDVAVYGPFERCKPLTAAHGQYCRSLGIPWYQMWNELEPTLSQEGCILDGLFGFGLSRPLTGDVAIAVERINQSGMPVISIDLPSGIHTDSGKVLGTAIKAATTLCLGLWKRACLQEAAQPYLGKLHLIDFDIPLEDIQTVLGRSPRVQRLTAAKALQTLPLDRSPVAHKYTTGQLLIIAGSRQYSGAALLTGYGAMASGVGMVTMVVPESIRLLILAQLPGALVLGTEETATGAIAALPDLSMARYDAIACGPGLAQVAWLPKILASDVPLLLDADALNGITAEQLAARQETTVITPHPGEFRRLFPDLTVGHEGALKAAQLTGATVVFKGSKVAVAADERLWINPDSTPALARGGSGDVLTGLMGGLMAQRPAAQSNAALSAVWWHAQAGLYVQQRRTVLGVDPLELARGLNPALAQYLREIA